MRAGQVLLAGLAVAKESFAAAARSGDQSAAAQHALAGGLAGRGGLTVNAGHLYTGGRENS